MLDTLARATIEIKFRENWIVIRYVLLREECLTRGTSLFVGFSRAVADLRSFGESMLNFIKIHILIYYLYCRTKYLFFASRMWIFHFAFRNDATFDLVIFFGSFAILKQSKMAKFNFNNSKGVHFESLL